MKGSGRLSGGNPPGKNMQRARGRGHAPDKAIQLQGGGAAGENGSLAEVQTQGLLGLQAADQAVTDGQPVQAGNEQLAGQQAAFINECLVWLTGGALVTACREGPRGCRVQLSAQGPGLGPALTRLSELPWKLLPLSGLLYRTGTQSLI